MTDAQGLRPFDPYRTLQLHAKAPRDLVEDAYWLLVSAHAGALSESRIEELNTAYATLLDGEARRSYDEEHGVRGPAVATVRARGQLLRLFSAKPPGVDVDDHDFYQVLRIDSEADSRIIQLAYDFWMQGLHGARVERERVEEAHRTLANPLLRTQYDARRDEAAPQPTVEITKQVHEQIRIARHNDVEAAPSAPITALPDSQPGASAPVPIAAQPVAVVPRSGNGHRVEPAVAGIPDAPRVEPVAPKSKSKPRPVEPAPAAASVEAPAPHPPDVHAHALPPATRLPAGRQLADAQHNRLLQLREDAVALAVPARSAPTPVPARPEPRSAGTLAFISGPRTGERFDLEEASVKLGSDDACQIVLHDAATNIEPEHARLWPHGDSYLFRDVAGHDTTIADQPLSLPVVLEDGDEIQIGVHRLRFKHMSQTTGSAPAAEEAV